MGEQKHKKPVSVWKPIVFICLILAGFVILFLVWQYFVNKPNYRDLKKEYEKITLPADWVKVSENSNTGLWGLFCWEIDNAACPSISSLYSTPQNKNPDQDKKFLIDLVYSLNYTIKSSEYSRCTTTSPMYSCSLTATRDDYAIRLSTGIDPTVNQKLLTILLGQSRGIGVK